MKVSKLMLLIYNLIFSPLPSYGLLKKMKVAVLRLAGVKIGDRCYIEQYVRFMGGGSLSIGNDVFISQNVFIQCGTSISIGNNVEVNYGTLLSANCGATLKIEDNCHIAHFCSLKCSTQIIDPELKTGSIVNGQEFKDIHIQRGSWLGAGVIVLPGVSVGAYNVIAAGAVVTKDSPDGVLLAGVPAVVKKEYLRKE